MNISASTFTTHYFNIPTQSLNTPIYLIPFGDIHRFASLCDVQSWHEFLTWAKAKPNAYFLGMGDYDDLNSESERVILSNPDLHEETKLTLEEIYQSRVNQLIREIGFMKGKIIGLIEGNHFGVFQTGMTTTQEMCRQLDCKYLGVCGLIRLNFTIGGRNTTLDIFAAHGKGAARLLGGSLNTVQQMSDIADCDVYLQGHDHQKIEGFRRRLYLQKANGTMRIRARKILFARTGSFLKGYVPDKPSYITKGLLPPTDIGVIKIELTPRRKSETKEGKVSSNFYIDIHCSI